MELTSIDVTKINSMKNEELTAYADEFKIEYNKDAINRGELIAALKGMVTGLHATQKNVKVVFHNVTGTNSEVYIELNGRAFRFPKDVPVMIPVELLNIVDESYEWRYEKQENGTTTRRKYMAQTYNIVND